MTVRQALCTVLLAAVVLPACQGPAVQDPADAATESPPPLEVSVTRYRRDRDTRRVQVKVGNEGTATVRVERVDLDAPGFAPVEPSVDDATIRPGLRVDLPVTVGEALCDGGDARPGEGATVVLAVRPADGNLREVSAPLDHPNDVLDRLQADECRRRALTEAADIGFGPSWVLEGSGAGAILRGSILMRRLAAEDALALTRLSGSVIFSVHPAGQPHEPVLLLDPATGSAELPIEVTAGRCDPHALAESKRTYVFELWVRIGAGPEEYLALQPDEEGRRRWDELARTACGLGG